jgi:ABC-2 type transport system ATP-binding protein
MNAPLIEMHGLVHRYGRTEALHGLDLTVERGRCHGLFGRNGAGKTTALKCLLNLLRPAFGTIQVFGMEPRQHEAAIKSRLAYVPDFVAFYPWMNVREALDYQASFRARWNRDVERELLGKFQLDPAHPTSGLSKGQRTQLALIGAICAEPELLVLDEPTSGLDPLIRREFIQTVIGAFQDAAPGERTVLVSTHLISEFEGLIDRFTIIDKGRAVLTSDADEARTRYQKLRARFEGNPPPLAEFSDARSARHAGRTLELVVNGEADRILDRLQKHNALEIERESLTLEEIFLTTVEPRGAHDH